LSFSFFSPPFIQMLNEQGMLVCEMERIKSSFFFSFFPLPGEETSKVYPPFFFLPVLLFSPFGQAWRHAIGDPLLFFPSFIRPYDGMKTPFSLPPLYSSLASLVDRNRPNSATIILPPFFFSLSLSSPSTLARPQPSYRNKTIE